MKRKLLLTTFVLGTILAQGVMAAEPVALTIDDAIYRAFATNPAVKIAGYELDAARANMHAVRLSRGLTITGQHTTRRSGNKDYGSTPLATEYIELKDASGNLYNAIKLNNTRTKGIGNNHANSVTASIPLYTGGEISGAMISAKAGYQQSVAGKQKAYNDMHYTVAEAYYNCLLTQDLAKVAQESVNSLSEHLRHVQDSYDVGVVAKVDVLRSEVELADAEQNLIKADNARKVAQHNLNKIIGLPLETELNLMDTLQFTPYEHELEYCLNFAETNHPELEQAKQGVRSAKGKVRSARSGYMPKIYGTASDNWNNVNWPGDENENWTVGVSATWTAFDSGVTMSRVHAAEANARAAKETYRDTMNSVMLDVRNIYYSMNEAERRIHTTEVIVAKAQEDYDIAQLRYQNGVGTNTDVLDAQVALNQAKTNYIQACYDFSTSKIALDNAIGVPFKSPLEKTTVVKVKSLNVKKAKVEKVVRESEEE